MANRTRTPIQLGIFENSNEKLTPKKTKKADSFLPKSNDYIYSGFSFGGGVQSTAIWLLIKYQPERLIDAVGHLPEKAYFADTHDEPTAVYTHIETLVDNHPSIPLQKISEMSIDSTFGRTLPPYFIKTKNGEQGIALRQCTHRLKITPIERAFKADAIDASGVEKFEDRSVSLWMGISIDEAIRMRVNQTRWIQNVYPLISLGMDRAACFNLCLEYGITPPKSACRRCPYRQDWVLFKQTYPEDFQIAVEADRQLRINPPNGLECEAYIHRFLLPLDKAVEIMEKQGDFAFEEGGKNECSGVCWV